MIIKYWKRVIQIKNNIIKPSSKLFEASSLERLLLKSQNNETCVYIVRTNEEIIENEKINECNENVIEKESQNPQFDILSNINEIRYNMCNVDVVEETNKEYIEGNDILNMNEYFDEIDRVIINTCTAKESNLPEKIDSIAENLTMLDENKKHIFISMLKQFKNLFLDNLGYVTNYIHKLRLKTKYPIIKQTYSVPRFFTR